MPVYKIADLKVGFEPKYNLLSERSEKYRCDGEPDFNIGYTDNLMEHQLDLYKGISEAEVEYLWMGTAFNVKLLEYNGMFLHSSTVVVDGKAYSFSAPCGTGKSTHTSLWLKLLGDKAFILNDDKAAYRLIDGKYYAYGTPFSGKHDINVNTSAELCGICFIEQAAENSIERMDIDSAVPLLISQTLRPSNVKRTLMLCDFIDELIKNIPVYKLKCNMNIDAAELSYETMKKERLF
ncbi:MAG: hypothetical protein IJ447_01175 [Clostridia bacterium]|nr:hypothetical protein [Clostridia bacterium]